MGIFSKKEKKELVLLFDIGSSSVGGAMFYMGADNTPQIIYIAREPIPIEEKINRDRFLELTMQALSTVANKICVKALGAPKRIFCVLSSPWFASETRTINYETGETFVFTQALADELLKKEIELFEKEHEEKYPSQEEKVIPIELKNMKIELNGYTALSPFKQKVENVKMTIFASIAEEKVLKLITDNIEKHFRFHKIRFSSFQLASFTVARDTFVHQDKFILVNIGGEVTDISMIKQDVLKDSISFPLGRNFIVRSLAQELNSSLDEAKTLVSMHKDGHMAENSSKKIIEAIEMTKNEWLKNFQEFLSKLTNDVSIPSTIFITVEPDMAVFFSEIIKNEQFNQYILTESKFRVMFLGSQALHGIAELNTEIHRDPAIIIESIYINRFLR